MARGARAPSGRLRRRGERRDPAATRRALVEAASALFSERGFDGVPIDLVAERAGVNKALISYHFRGKHGLYVAVLVSVFAELAARVAAIEAEGRGVRETLRALLSAFAELARERPAFPGLWVRELISHGIEPALAPYVVEIAGVTRRLAERGMRDGTFRRVDPLIFHFGLVGGTAFFLATDPARRRAVREGHIPFAMPEAADFLRHIEELTVRGLAPDAGAPRPPSRARKRRALPRR
jgi:TetR/AcrR family transcriptional regulator